MALDTFFCCCLNFCCVSFLWLGGAPHLNFTVPRGSCSRLSSNREQLCIPAILDESSFEVITDEAHRATSVAQKLSPLSPRISFLTILRKKANEEAWVDYSSWLTILSFEDDWLNLPPETFLDMVQPSLSNFSYLHAPSIETGTWLRAEERRGRIRIAQRRT